MIVEIVFHPTGDWEGLYINNRLMREGHSIQLEDFLSACNQDFYLEAKEQFEYRTRDLGNEEGFDEDYNLPLNYEDIKPS